MSELVWSCFAPVPTRGLSPNGSRGSWHKHATARREYREDCEQVFRIAAPRTPFKRVIVRRTMVLCRRPMYSQKRVVRPGVPMAALDRYRPTDSDNAAAAMKPLLDALQTTGVIESDNAEVCMVPEVTFAEAQSWHDEHVLVEVYTQ